MFSQSVELGDLDGDQDIDAIVGNDLGPGIEIWLNDGAGNFSEGQHLIHGTGTNSTHPQLGDLDGDGDLDAIVMAADANCCNQIYGVFMNDGTANFSLHPTIPTITLISGAGEAALGDVDGDGDLDAMITGGNVGLGTYLNDGSGGLVLSASMLPFGGLQAVRLGDVDDDGDLDAVTGASPAMDVCFNDGGGVFVSGIFSGKGSVFGSTPGDQFTLADVNGDGTIDLATTCSGACIAPARLFFNDGTGVFVDSGQDLANNGKDVEFADLDGDGDLDGFFAREGGGSGNQVWLNEALSDASATFRNGQGINPPDYTTLDMPVIGGGWSSMISLAPTTPGATVVSTGMGWEFQGGSSGALYEGFEILLDLSAPNLFFDIALGVHEIPVPCKLNLVGVPVWTQGFRIEDLGGGLSVVLLNGVDVVIGA